VSERTWFRELWGTVSKPFSNRSEEGWAQRPRPPALPLTASWLLRPNQGRSTLGKVLGEIKISTAKKPVLQSIAGAFPCTAVLHKEAQADADVAAQRKRPDAWAVSWEKLHLLILEFPRPNDRGELSLHETDLYKNK
jgi:hypothetical protein